MESLERVNAVSSKTKLVLESAKTRFGEDDADCKRLGKLMKTIDNLALRRNAVIHGRWSISSDEPASLIWKRRFGAFDTPEVYPIDRLRTLLNDIEKKETELRSFFNTVFSPRLEVEAKSFIRHIISSNEIENGG